MIALLLVMTLAGPGDLDAVLRAHVHQGRVDYEGLRRDRSALDRYLAWVAEAPPGGDVVFWLNAYNALCIEAVLQGGSPEDLEAFFRGRRFRVAGRDRTLDEVEDEVLRSLHGDPRLHFALVCASRSCAPLLERAWTAEDLERTLDERTRAFVGDEKRVRLDPETGTLYLSKLFEWYREDFERSAGSVEDFLVRYLPEDRKALLRSRTWTVQPLPYDWRLNQAGEP